jgi:carotenoid cleavage dioxygenase
MVYSNDLPYTLLGLTTLFIYEETRNAERPITMATLGSEIVPSHLNVTAEKQHESYYGLSSPWETYYHPIETSAQGRFECELDEMVVFGEIPTEISGTWYRMMIDPHFLPYEKVPFVDGDGHVCAFRIQDGKVSMKIKYVHTERWLLERKAGRRLFGRYRNPYDNHPCVRLANDSTGNTNIIYWGGNLLALAERGLPYAMDPDTLQTRGADPYGDQVAAKTFSAHPKVDPHTNQLITWSYHAKGLSTSDICTYAIDPNGRISDEQWFKQDKPGWPHDGWITDNWLILSNMPFGVNSDEVMKAGGNYWRFIPDQPSELLVTPRYRNPNHPDWKPGELRKFTARHGLIIHTGNAWEEEGGILKLESHFVNFNVFDFLNPEEYEGPKGKPSGGWYRWTVDLSKPNGTAIPPPEKLFEGIFDFPIFDERMTGRKTRIVYLGAMTGLENGGRPGFNAILKLNTETGEKEVFYPTDNGTVAEPAYIPRGPGCEEGDGWLIFYTERESSPKAELVILDCKDFSRPVAVAQMPFKTRMQVHGNWVPNPHPERPLPSLMGPVQDVTPTPKYSQLNKLP